MWSKRSNSAFPRMIPVSAPNAGAPPSCRDETIGAARVAFINSVPSATRRPRPTGTPRDPEPAPEGRRAANLVISAPFAATSTVAVTAVSLAPSAAKSRLSPRLSRSSPAADQGLVRVPLYSLA